MHSLVQCGGKKLGYLESLNASNFFSGQYYVVDTTMFHPNKDECTLPNNAPIVFASIFSVVWFIIWCFLVDRMYRLKKRRVIFLARCTFVYHTSLELLMMSTVFQEGFYESAAVFLTLAYVVAVALMTLIMVHMLEFSTVLPPVKVEKMKRKFFGLMWVGIGVESGLGIMCAILARTDYFNSVLAGLLLSHQLVATSATFLCFKYTNEFLTKTLKDETEYSELTQRIQGMKHNWVMLTGSNLLLPLPMVALWAFFGHIPFQYIFCYGALTIGALSTIGLLSLFPRYSSSANPTVTAPAATTRPHRNSIPSRRQDEEVGGDDDTTEPLSDITARVCMDNSIHSSRVSCQTPRATRETALCTMGDDDFIVEDIVKETMAVHADLLRRPDTSDC